MSEYSTSKAREQFSDLINQAAYSKERVVLTRRGKKLVAIIPIEDLELIEAMEDEEDLRDAQEALAEYKRTGEAISLEELKKELGWD